VRRNNRSPIQVRPGPGNKRRSDLNSNNQPQIISVSVGFDDDNPVKQLTVDDKKLLRKIQEENQDVSIDLGLEQQQKKNVISFKGVAAKVKRCMMMAFTELKNIGFEYPQIRSEAFNIEVSQQEKRNQVKVNVEAEAEKVKEKEPRPRKPITPPDETSKAAPVPSLIIHNHPEYKNLQQKSKKILDAKNEEIKKLKEENKLLKDEKDTQVQTIANSKAHVIKLQGEVEEYKDSNVNLHKQLEEFKQKHEKSMAQLSQIMQNQGDPQNLLKAKDDEIRSLKDKLNKVSSATPVKIKTEPREYSESVTKNISNDPELISKYKTMEKKLRDSEKKLRDLEPKYIFKKKELWMRDEEIKELKRLLRETTKERNSLKSKESPVVINDE